MNYVIVCSEKANRGRSEEGKKQYAFSRMEVDYGRDFV